MKQKILAGLTALLLALGVTATVGGSASAHTGAVTGVAVCETDGTYSITWTYNATNVPDGIEAETKAMTTSKGSLAPIDGVNKGGQIFLSVWTDHQINVPGAPVKTGNWSAQFKTVGIPGDFKGTITTMVQTDWNGGPSEDPVGEVPVDGTCTPPVVTPPVEEPPVVTPPVEEPPVVTPPTEEPPVVTPPTEEPPVVTPPTEETTPEVVPAPVVESSPAPVVTVEVVRTDVQTTELAATGADYEDLIPIGFVAFILLGGGILGIVAGYRRRRTN